MITKTEQIFFEACVEECKEIIKQCGFTLPEIEFSLKDRKSRTLALHIYHRDSDTHEIQIMLPYFREFLKLKDFHSINDTMLHEMCHALPNGGNHGEGWKRYTRVVNSKFGFNLGRLVQDSENLKIVKKNIAKYKVVCMQCGEVSYIQSKIGVIKNPSRYNCAKCGGSLKVEVL